MTLLIAPPRQFINRIRTHGWGVVGFASFVILMVLGALAYKIHTERLQAIETTYRANANLARAFEEHIVRTIRGVDQVVLFVKFQIERHGNKIDLQDYLADMTNVGPLLVQVAVINEQGELINSNLPFKPMNLADREHFRIHLNQDSGKLFISKPVLGRASGRWSIQMTRRINRPNGDFGGVVVVSVDPYYFSRFYSEVDLGVHGSILLTGDDRIVRVHTTGERTTIGQNIGDAELFRQLRQASIGNYTAVSAIDGVRRLISYRQVKDLPFIVAVGSAQDDALESFYLRRNSYILFSLVFSLSVIVFAAWLNTLSREQELATQAMRASQAKAESANRMKSEFLASMSHELRTPLNGILGYAEYLRDQAPDDTHKEFANTIYTSGMHLLEIVNAILDLAKIEAGKMTIHPETVEIHTFLEDIIVLHRSVAEGKGLLLNLDIGEDVPTTVFCDPVRLRQVLNNLIHNAIKFTDHGIITVAVARQGGRISFEVTDTGVGIDPTLHAHIFERFRQGEESFLTRRSGGTGLGLALVKELVEMMGGQVQLISTPGEGSCFRFTLSMSGVSTDSQYGTTN